MRIIVTGGRNFNDPQTLRRILGKINPTEIAHGAAPGADLHARYWGEDNGVKVTPYLADWAKYGGSAGPIRNEKMLKDFKPDAVLAFPGNVGTRHMMSIAERDKVPVYDTCFVFGSNLSGRHGKGAAKNAAEHWQAKYGVGCGPTGWSYGIPTKDETVVRRLGLADIAFYVGQFVVHAGQHPNTIFFVTAIGCGLAGYRNEDISPFFAAAPTNCIMPMGWPENFKLP